MTQPKKNEYWHVQYGEAVGKEYNIIVLVKEDNPPNRKIFTCEYQGEELIVGQEFFIEKFL